MSKVRLTGTTSGFTELTAPAVAGSNTITLPIGNGSADQRLVTNGSGALSFTSDVMLAAGSAGSPSLYFSGDTNTGMWSPAADTLAWSTGGTERMRISQNGVILVNTTSTDPIGSSASQSAAFGPGASAGALNYYNASETCVKLGRGSNGSLIDFFRNQPSPSLVGSISVTTTATAYNTSSDYRLKENVVPLDGAIARLNQIPVHRFNFIADPDTVVDGFIAHEAQEVVPECVTGTKDEVDDDGNPVMQGIDQSKLVPLLTAALQEAIAKIDALEARIAALELN